MTKKTGTEFAHGRLSILELLLLSFVREGLNTPYDLISKAGISVGVSSPAFKRLVKVGFLKPTKGPRNRVNYALTEKGEEKFRDNLQKGLADFWRMDGSTTFDLFPRVFLLIWVNFGIDEAGRCIHVASNLLRAQAVAKAFEVERYTADLMQQDLAISDGISLVNKGNLMALALRYMKASADVRVIQHQADAVNALGPEFGRLLYDLEHGVKRIDFIGGADVITRVKDKS